MKFYSRVITCLSLLCSIRGSFAGVPVEQEYLLSQQVEALDGPEMAMDSSFPIMVEYKSEVGLEAVVHAATDGEIVVHMESIGYVAINCKNVQALIDLENNDEVGMVEYDGQMQVLVHERGESIPVEEHRRLQGETIPFGIERVNVAGIPPATTGFKPKVCVIDTGYDLGHIDLPTQADGVDGYTPPEYPFETWEIDGNSHGTHCAGTIGAIGGNGLGVTSVNPDPASFTFFIAKGLSDSGSGFFSAIISSIEECQNEGANIISMSLGGGGFSRAMESAVNNAYNAGVLVIAAAGNGGSSRFSFPASYNVVMSVAATDSNDNKAGFSQFNSQVEIAAPGVGVLSTFPGNRLATFSGTSMATPHVAGVAARVWAHFPQCTNHQIRAALLRTARDRGVAGCDVNFGFGIVDGQAAFDVLAQFGCEGAGGTTPSPPSSGANGGCAQVIPPLQPKNPEPPTPDGDMILLDMLPNPNGDLRDRDGEYVRLKNPTKATIDLGADGYQVCRLRGTTLNCKTLTGQVQPDGIYTACRNGLFFDACDIDVNFSLRNRPTTDTVVLRKGGEILEETQYEDARGSNAGACWTRISEAFEYRPCEPIS